MSARRSQSQNAKNAPLSKCMGAHEKTQNDMRDFTFCDQEGDTVDESNVEENAHLEREKERASAAPLC